MDKAIFFALLGLIPLAAQPDRFGLPACSGPDRELAVKHSFLVCHSGAVKAPLWTIHELPPSHLTSPVSSSGRRSRFRRDWTLSMPGASDADYRNSGFSRGHLVPARDVAGDEQSLRDSFLLSNAVAQDSSMNLSIWRRLENRTRRLSEAADSVIVVTGVVFDENARRIGAGRVGVPREMYKVILSVQGSQFRLIAFAVPNAPAEGRSLESFLVTVTQVEQRTGLRFFPRLGARPQ